MGFLQSSGKFLSSKAKGHSAGASKEMNKTIAKDPSVPADARLRGAFRAVGDRFKEDSHKRQADAHKHAAKHNY